MGKVQPSHVMRGIVMAKFGSVAVRYGNGCVVLVKCGAVLYR